MSAFPHLHVNVGQSQRAGTYRLSLFSSGWSNPDRVVEFTTFGTLDEIESTAKRSLADVGAIRETLRCTWCMGGHAVEPCFVNPDGSHVRGCGLHSGMHPADWCREPAPIVRMAEYPGSDPT